MTNIVKNKITYALMDFANVKMAKNGMEEFAVKNNLEYLIFYN